MTMALYISRSLWPVRRHMARNPGCTPSTSGPAMPVRAVRVVLGKIGPFGPEWIVGPNIGSMALPLEVARRWLAEADGGWRKLGNFRDVTV
jgi:hypothetical protein